MSKAQPEQDQSQRARAKRYASGLLGRRAYSRSRLIDRIVRRGFDERMARGIADDFARIGLLDDDAYADSFVRAELARKPAGAILLETKLASKGIDRATARRAATEALSGRDLIDDASDLARRRLRVFPESLDEAARRRRLFSALARRGFDPDTCRRAVDRVLGV